MIKTTKADFEFFKSECRRFHKQWGVTCWEILFSWKKIPGRLAEVNMVYESGIAAIDFTTEWENSKINRECITRVAKEEILHILMGRFSCLASSRHVREEELEAAEHEAIRMLEKIIPD